MHTSHNWPIDGSPVVVLGGSGFIGTRLVRILRHQHFQVRIGDIRRSADYPELWQSCDVRDLSTLRTVFEGAGTIINLAAEHRDDVRPVSRYHETNVEGAKSVCHVAQETGVKKIIFTSSVAVYGFQGRPVDESGPTQPANPYGATKLEAEGVYSKWCCQDSGRSLVIVRPTVVFGEMNRGNVYNLFRQVASGRFLMVGSGTNVKSMAYVGNLVEFLSYCLSFGPGESVFNYADTPDMTTRMIVAQIKSALGDVSRTPSIPFSFALLAGRLLDVVARMSGKSFPLSAVRVQKFCETTQFIAERVAASGFVRPYSLQDALSRTVRFEFPDCKQAESLSDEERSSESDLDTTKAGV